MNTKAQGMAFDMGASGAAALARPDEASRAGDSLLCALLVVYLASLMLEGVLRYTFAVTGIPNALYLRDAIPVATLVVLFLRALLIDNRIDLGIAIPAALLAFHAAYAAMLGVAFFSIGFGLKIFMFIPYGMAMWPLIRPRLDRALTVALVMFAVTVVGVFANYFLETMPWEGLEYDTAFGAVSTTRMWWIEWAARLPGLARTSFNAATIVGITGLLTWLKFRQPIPRLLIVVCAMTAITLTTSKGMILAFPLAAAWLLVQRRRPAMSGAVLVGAVCVVTSVLPLLIVYLDLGSAVPQSSFPALLGSVWERFYIMWPLAFELLPDGAPGFLGAGLGSIGTPQLYGNAPHHYNAADNFAVFMMISCGLPGLFYYAFPAFALPRVAAAENRTVHRAYVGILLIAYAYGMSISMVEDSFFSVFFGLCCGVAASVWRSSES